MNESFIPTARNSERFVNFDRQAKYGRPDRYIPGFREKERAEDRQTVLRKAAALRHALRLEQHCKIAFSGDPWQRGCLRMLEQLLSVREAENLEVLYLRDRALSNMVEGVRAFEAISKEQCAALRNLQANAFDMRIKELTK